MSTPIERVQQFKKAISDFDAKTNDAIQTMWIAPEGHTNNARIVQGGLFMATKNLETYLRNVVEHRSKEKNYFVFSAVFNFPPADELHVAILINKNANVFNYLLKEMYEKRKIEISGDLSKKNSNNVKFYITNSGKIYPTQEFISVLTDRNGDYLIDILKTVEVDRILFSAWPPDASVRRSLLIREYAGYLGSMVGPENIVELQVWSDERIIRPEMQRMPDRLNFEEELVPAIKELGGNYPRSLIARYHASLNFYSEKHFVILAGISGTGKTLLALTYAKAVHGLKKDADDPLLVVCPVRPDWTDSIGLLGYNDVLTGKYVVPPFLQAVLLATAHKSSPVFVVLDEMNLARVEYYLADVLSAMESGEALVLHQSGVPLPGSTGEDVPNRLHLPQNLFITGTINIDETTHGISDKVLDRAMLIDMSEIDLTDHLDRLASDPSFEMAVAHAGALLTGIHDILKVHQLQFGYRTAGEVIRYLTFASTLPEMDLDVLMDDLLMQKILTRLRGGEAQRTMLDNLYKLFAASGFEVKYPRALQLITRLLQDLNEFGSFQTAR